MQRLEVLERLVLAHQLDQRRKHRVGGARRVGIGDLDLVLELGLDQIGPAFRLGNILCLQLLGVEAVAERAGVYADSAVLGLFGLPHRPILQLGKSWRLVRLGQSFLGRLEVEGAVARFPDGSRYEPVGLAEYMNDTSHGDYDPKARGPPRPHVPSCSQP